MFCWLVIELDVYPLYTHCPALEASPFGHGVLPVKSMSVGDELIVSLVVVNWYSPTKVPGCETSTVVPISLFTGPAKPPTTRSSCAGSGGLSSMKANVTVYDVNPLTA